MEKNKRVTGGERGKRRTGERGNGRTGERKNRGKGNREAGGWEGGEGGALLLLDVVDGWGMLPTRPKPFGFSSMVTLN